MMIFVFWPFFFIPLAFFFFARFLPRLLRDLRDRDERSIFRDHPLTYRKTRSGKIKRVRGRSVEATIFKLAYRMRGRITLSDIILETGLNMKDAEEHINRMVDGIRVVMEVDVKGLVVYEFPEIIARYEREGDQDSFR
jgi:hypothetical protein